MAALTSIVLLAPVIGPGGRWPDEFPALEVIVCDHRRHELAGTGVTDFNMPETVTSQGRGFVRERYFPSLSAPLNSRWCSGRAGVVIQ